MKKMTKSGNKKTKGGKMVSVVNMADGGCGRRTTTSDIKDDQKFMTAIKTIETEMDRIQRTLVPQTTQTRRRVQSAPSTYRRR